MYRNLSGKGKRNLSLFWIVSPLEAILSVLFALLLEPVINAGESRDAERLVIMSIALVVTGLFNMLVSFWVDRCKITVKNDFAKEIRHRYYDGLFDKTIQSFNQQKNAFYYSKITTESEEISDNYCGGIMGLYSALVSFTVSIIALTSIHWVIVVAIVITAICSLLLPRLFEKSRVRHEDQFLADNERYIKVLSEGLRAFSVIKAFRIRISQVEDHKRASDKLSDSKAGKEITDDGITVAAMTLSQFSFVMVIVIGAFLTYKGITTFGAVLAASQLIGGVMAPFEYVPGYIMSVKLGKPMLREYCASSVRLNDADYESIPVREHNIIELQDVAFSYSGDGNILDKISMKIDTGRKYLVIGASGGGKSTLAKLVAGQILPSSGRVLINSVSVDRIKEEDLTKLITYQEQSPILFNDTVKNNILLGREVTDDRFTEIIRESLLQKFVEEHQDGVNTLAGDSGKSLSGGEAQRVSFARNRVEPAEFTVYDEVTANLDRENTDQIIKLITGKSEGAMIITHDVTKELLSSVDCILILEDGKIAEAGNYDEIKGSPVLEKYIISD